MKLVELHREFIERSVRPIISNDLPIKVSNTDKPIIAVEKWQIFDRKLTKKFLFETYEDRNRFLKSLIEYENQQGHHSSFIINDLTVEISLITKTVNKVTELDKAYAKYADVIRRDLVYNTKDV
jgi:pterin-4a-carbinolamine dehydratase